MKRGFSKVAVALSLCLATGLLSGCQTAGPATTDSAATQPAQVEPTYSLVQNVYNWGANYSKVIVPVDFSSDKNYVDPDDYVVSVERYDTEGNLLDSGNRVVDAAYRSDETGMNTDDGNYVTLDLAVSATMSLAQPYYTGSNGLKSWADCKYTIENSETGDSWTEAGDVYHPDEEKFQTDSFTSDGITIPYAYYGVDDGEDHPLIIWLHGAGSGGTDIGFVTGGMLVTNFVSDEVQEIFGGANILLPQSETIWMDAGNGTATEDGTSRYTVALKALIDEVVANNNVDTSRIYVGGCSNGGFMTVRLIVDYPEMFAACFPVCQAMNSDWVSDEQVQAWTKIPTWFVHSTLDPTVNFETTSDALYHRLLEAGAENLHFTKYDEIVDPDYGNTYLAHNSWVYALKNLCDTDYDGSKVTVNGQEVNLYQWLATCTK